MSDQNPFLPLRLSPRLQAALHSTDPAQQLLALLVVLRAAGPSDIQVCAEGCPLPAFQLETVLHTAAQRIRASEMRERPKFGFRLVGKLPKTMKIGEKIDIKADIIDRQGNICALPTASTCKLTVLSPFAPVSMEKRVKRLRQEYISGITEKEISSSSVVFEKICFTEASNKQPEGAFTLQLECEGVMTLEIPNMRVL